MLEGPIVVEAKHVLSFDNSAVKSQTPNLLRRLGTPSEFRKWMHEAPEMMHLSVFDDAGWHMSSFGGIERVRDKLVSSYLELAAEDFFTDRDRLERIVKAGVPHWQLNSAQGLEESLFPAWEVDLSELPAGAASQPHMFLKSKSQEPQSTIDDRANMRERLLLQQDFIKARLEGRGGTEIAYRPRTNEHRLEVTCEREVLMTTQQWCDEHRIAHEGCQEVLRRCSLACETKSSGEGAVINFRFDTSTYMEMELDGKKYMVEMKAGEKAEDVAQAWAYAFYLGPESSAILADALRAKRGQDQKAATPH
ncbi:unnamed protein product [Chrysoparadoxa australica]